MDESESLTNKLVRGQNMRRILGFSFKLRALLMLSVFLTCLEQSECLKCYNCNTMYSKDCGDKFYNHYKYIVNCKFDETYCIVRDQQSAFKEFSAFINLNGFSENENRWRHPTWLLESVQRDLSLLLRLQDQVRGPRQLVLHKRPMQHG